MHTVGTHVFVWSAHDDAHLALAVRETMQPLDDGMCNSTSEDLQLAKW